MEDMTAVCPHDMCSASKIGDIEDCVCLPIRVVEQDVLAGVSPFGCVCIQSSLMMLLIIFHPTTTI